MTNRKTQSIRPTNDRFYQTPAQIQAYAAAVADRIAFWNGTAPEMDVSEPPRVRPTLPPPPKQARRAAEALGQEPAFLDLGNRWLPWD